MTMPKKLSMIIVVLLWFSFTSVFADSAGPMRFERDTHYAVLETPLPEGVAPVVEFIYFGCASCYQIAPVFSQWASENQVQVALVPAHSESVMVDAAQLFHTFAEMGQLGKMYDIGYVIFQTTKVELQGKDRIDHYLKRHNIDIEKFWSVWSSEAVSQRLQHSAALTRLAKVSQTPTFVVQRRYVPNLKSVKSSEELFELLNFLLQLDQNSNSATSSKTS